MSPTKYLIGFLTVQLIGRTCLAEIIIETPKSEDFSSLIEATVRVLKSCDERRGNAIGIAGSSTSSLIVSLSSDYYLPVVVIGKTAGRPSDVSPRRKLSFFVITAGSPTKLWAILEDVKKSSWWNHMANFYIIESPVNEKSCSRALKFLSTAWRADVLEAKFFCNHPDKGPLIYGFNPYTSSSTSPPWTLVEMNENQTIDNNNNPSWSLLERKYSVKKSIVELCRNMNFDKTRNLEGHEIRASLVNRRPIIWMDNKKIGVDSIRGHSGDMFRAIFRSLNATVKIIVLDNSTARGSIDNEGNTDLLAPMYDRISDIGLNDKNPYGNVKILRWTYPHYYTGLYVVTRYRGDESQVKKIISLIDLSSRIGLSLVFITTILFLRYIVGHTPQIAVLNTIRLFCNSCLNDLPIYPASRIYLGSLFFLVVTIQGIYQGQLSALLSNRVPLNNVDTMEDLRESRHVIYGKDSYGVYFREGCFEGRFVGIKGYDCTEQVSRDPSIACVRSRDGLIPKASRLKLHMSTEPIVKLPLSWIIREDWPLEGTMNSMIGRLVEADFYRYTYERSLQKSLSIMRANDIENRDRTCKVLILTDLSFAFAILGIGVVLSGLCFIGEFLTRRFRFYFSG